MQQCKNVEMAQLNAMTMVKVKERSLTLKADAEGTEVFLSSTKYDVGVFSSLRKLNLGYRYRFTISTLFIILPWPDH